MVHASHAQREIEMVFGSVSSNMAKDGLWEKSPSSQSVHPYICMCCMVAIYRLSFWFYSNFMCSRRFYSADKDHDYEFDFLSSFGPLFFVVHLLFDFDLFGFCRYFILHVPLFNFFVQFLIRYRNLSIVTQLTKAVYPIAIAHFPCECVVGVARVPSFCFQSCNFVVK